MSPIDPQKLGRVKAFHAAREEEIRLSVLNRWTITDWSLNFPWWRDPPQVRILMYADGDTRVAELAHVKNLLEAHPYPHVSFKVTTRHREDDGVKLTDINLLADFDELWLFGSKDNPNLPDAEKQLVEKFEAAPKCGGVLVTGDHMALGRALAGVIPRAGVMRRWDVPAFGPNRLSSLEEGGDSDLTFNTSDEADDLPQSIHYRRFPVDAPDGVRLQPHPVLCGPDGPIEVLPDHQHEGEAIAPDNLADFPIIDGHQEKPFVIAWADVKDPQVQYRQFGVISAYNGHVVNVGRIVADASWHHWFASNLKGIEGTPQGQAALKKIEAFFLNCGAWLAPPALQTQMRLSAWWSIVWASEIREIPPDAPLSYFGERATKELRRFASSSAVSEWVLGPVTFNKALTDASVAAISDRTSLFNLPVEQFVAGGILRALMNAVGPFNPQATFPQVAPPDQELQLAIDRGTQDALSTIETQLKNDAINILAAVAGLRPK